ncbi:hypothetical protein B0H10DRAFT_2044743 [Mycena sp. CBHHK59/15]|nr:hypothetical protein B0H10DRAFT_2044743 [Mycena sp. CBHHK59/15]
MASFPNATRAFACCCVCWGIGGLFFDLRPCSSLPACRLALPSPQAGLSGLFRACLQAPTTARYGGKTV